MELSTEHLELNDDGIQHTRFQHLEEHARHPEYVAVDTVESESGNGTYLVGVIDTLTKPFGEADAVADGVLVGVCGCWDFQNRQSNGNLEYDNPLDLDEWSCCKHLRGRFKEYELYNRDTDQ